jgi:hypothetical protein
MVDYKRKMGIEEDKDSPAYYREKENVRMSKPGKYDSIRPAGEEERLSKSKSAGLKQAAMGAGLAPASIAFETAFGGRSSKDKGPIGAAVSQLSGAGDRLVNSTKEAADSIGGGMRKYKNAKSEEADLDAELGSQTKRETRGKAKGGSIFGRPGDEKTLEGGGSGGGYSSKNKSKMFNDAGDVAAAPLAVAMGLLGVKKGMDDSNEKARLGRDPRFVAENYSNEGRNKTKKAKGGSVSARADGIAQRGKTKGRMC